MLTRRAFTVLLATVLPASAVSARVPMIFATDGLAIRGYDPVAYFRERGPVPGKAAYRVMWKGAVWQFASARHLDLFEANPRAFAPRYGGYCAYAVSRGYTASTDPRAWRIEGGQLYLNHSLRVRELWQRDIPGNISKANANWPAVLSS